MKRTIALVLALLLVVALGACGPTKMDPTTAPTAEPTAAPTAAPTTVPTTEPIMAPTTEPTVEPTTESTVEPTTEPTAEPTTESTVEPTTEPTAEPTTEPTVEPTTEPTAEPTSEPTVEPTAESTAEPTTEPTVEPTTEPTTAPTEPPTEPPATEPPVSDPTVPPEVTLKLNKRVLDLYVGDTYTLKATYSGASGTPTWKIESGSDVVQISATSGEQITVTAKSVGIALISVSYGGKTVKAAVEVYEPEPTEPEIGPAVSVWTSSNNGSFSVGRVGNYLGFTAGGRNADGVNMRVTVSSSNTGVATVSESLNGSSSYVTVSFIGTGSTTITLTSIDGEVSTSFTIEVKNYSTMSVSTPQDYVNAVNSVVQQNGCSLYTGSYTVLTLSDAQLSWGSAVAQGESLAHRAWSIGGKTAACTYEGVDEYGEHIFYLHCS